MSSPLTIKDLDPDVAMDGASEKLRAASWSRQPQPAVTAIFVHAGAGYHSTTNEHIHLTACADAARVAMKVLRARGTAVEAVEAAIRALEDKEITNAGFGSNLTMEGIVECDATMVDHLGRSGACGAVAKIKNPIHLARVILDASSQPLSLRRVPPNLLIADGASEFGYEHGLQLVPHEDLVSRNARERFLRWREDLRRANLGPRSSHPDTPRSSSSSQLDLIDPDYEERIRAKQRRDHFNALMNGTWNEGQPDSPQAPSPQVMQDDNISEAAYFTGDQCPVKPPTPLSSVRTPDNRIHSRSGSPVYRHHGSPMNRSASSPHKRPRFHGSQSSDGYGSRTGSILGPNASGSMDMSEGPRAPSSDAVATLGNLSSRFSIERKSTDGSAEDGPADRELTHTQDSTPFPSPARERGQFILHDIDEDLITDTVGAIAIDVFGNIAAGSSSGGIGMKHRGRVGPAALVGVGTAVVPADPADEEGITTAAVTSGTGEHMATTIASQKCAERLFHCQKRGSGGISVPASEEEAMESFVVNDFMDHPGVRNSHSAGAIGVMAVKKTPYGYFLHFAHNTDSFALASMHSGEKEPKCVMSRIGDHGSVVRGGRKIRVD